ncbi:lipopolysaccharide transport periplasmic protein LptA [Sedimenticola hydrogenitrophicus]|uniref:lipopolysaccharide transport periplasmic protein LptA n=1 Tax=Sedimenticola hydrogenitrophicus TaxID=2967975 RepID=UPI0023B0957E|nr:lipopolysaccharide transport periplasmic protein LptA [Sedimenticola hydrogenitrophicus]
MKSTLKGPRKNNSVVPRAFLGHAGKARFAGNGCSLAKKRNATSGVQGRPNTGTYSCAGPKDPHARCRWLAIALLLILPGVAAALQSDKDQPIYIEADAVDIDDRSGISTYKGNVELTQGSILITADQVTVTQRPDKNDQIEAIGNPATFRQETEGDKGTIKGRARKAEYSANSEIINMTGDAVLTQGQDTFKSDRIIYDRARAVVKAGASAQGKERVRVTIGGKK